MKARPHNARIVLRLMARSIKKALPLSMVRAFSLRSWLRGAIQDLFCRTIRVPLRSHTLENQKGSHSMEATTLSRRPRNEWHSPYTEPHPEVVSGHHRDTDTERSFPSPVPFFGPDANFNGRPVGSREPSGHLQAASCPPVNASESDSVANPRS